MDNEEDEQLSYRITNIILICLLLNILPDRVLHKFMFDIVEHYNENYTNNRDRRKAFVRFLSNQRSVITRLQTDFRSMMLRHDSYTIQNSVLGLEEREEIYLYRGFKPMYFPFLDWLDTNIKPGQEFNCPLYLSTSISYNTSLNFIYNLKPVIWKIVVPSDKFGELPHLFFNNKPQVTNIEEEYGEYEVLVPIGTRLKYNRKYTLDNQSYRMPKLDGGYNTVNIELPVTVLEYEFLGLDFRFFKKHFTSQKFSSFVRRFANSVYSVGSTIGRKKSKRLSKKK